MQDFTEQTNNLKCYCPHEPTCEDICDELHSEHQTVFQGQRGSGYPANAIESSRAAKDPTCRKMKTVLF